MRCKNCSKEVIYEINDICQLCFINEEKPTKNNQEHWLYVYNEKNFEIDESNQESMDELLANPFNIRIENDKIIFSNTKGEVVEKVLTVESIDEVARIRNFVSGKWLLFEHEFDIDSTWIKIGKATIEGELGPSSKVSTALSSSKSKRYVICVYTMDYLNLDDVNRVREKLREMGFRKEINYKPDIYTDLGIYKDTSIISPTRYKS